MKTACVCAVIRQHVSVPECQLVSHSSPGYLYTMYLRISALSIYNEDGVCECFTVLQLTCVLTDCCVRGCWPGAGLQSWGVSADSRSIHLCQRRLRAWPRSGLSGCLRNPLISSSAITRRKICLALGTRQSV